jgi:hypothetical protein
MHRVLAWLKARLEVIVPLLAVPTFFAMVELTQGEVKAGKACWYMGWRLSILAW